MIVLSASGCSALPALVRPTPTLWLPAEFAPAAAQEAAPQAVAATASGWTQAAGPTQAPAAAPTAAAPSGATEYQEDFEDGQAQGWRLDPHWKVILDGSNHVLAGEDHTWADFGQDFSGDLRETLRVKLMRGRIHVVFHRDDFKRYFVGFETGGTELNRQESETQFSTDLARGTSTFTTNRWYQLEIVLQGTTLELLVDGQRAWSYTDSHPFTHGNIAFEAFEDSLVYVDDIVVSTP